MSGSNGNGNGHASDGARRAAEPVGAVMVCGAGITGIQASLDLAESGFKVYLVDSSPAIGGRMAQLDKTFPTGDCAMCIISPKLVEVARNKNIEIITLADVQGISGEPGNFKVKLRQNPRYVDTEQVQRLRRLHRGLPGRPAQRVRPAARHAQGDLPALPAGHPQRLRHLQGRGTGALQGLLPGRRQRPGLRGPGGGRQVQGGLRAGARALPAARPRADGSASIPARTTATAARWTRRWPSATSSGSSPTTWTPIRTSTRRPSPRRPRWTPRWPSSAAARPA